VTRTNLNGRESGIFDVSSLVTFAMYPPLAIGRLTAVGERMKSELIDPKFDKIPADKVELTDAEREKLLHQKPILGLSINDTIANSANHSVGARGVDTSQVESGGPKHPDTTLGELSDDELS